MRSLLLFALAAATLPLNTASAQFSEFAVTDDGRLFFTTTLRTGAEDNRSKVYRITGDGLSLFATGGDSAIGRTAGQPFTSGDGSITGYALSAPCRTGSCGFFALPRTNFALQGTEVASRQFDTLQISRNGRFLLGLTYDARARLIDLASNTAREFPQFRPPASRQAVANSGESLLLTVYDGPPPVLHVPFGEDPRPIPGTDHALSAFLSPIGGRVAYVRSAPDGFELVLTDPQGATHRVLTRAPDQNAFQPSFANDGTLLYLDAAGRVHLLTPAGESRTFASLLSGVKQAIISGNAELAWLTSATGQLLRVRTADGVPDEIIPETPVAQQGTLFALPGSVVRLHGSGFTTRTRFQLGDLDLPISELTSSSAALQIPWEYEIANGPRTLALQGPANPFVQLVSFAPLDQPAISFERDRTGAILQAAHHDFRGVLSPDDPARPGETIHLFVRNMGPVDQPVATGEPSPTSPPARVTTPFACYLYEFDTPTPPPRIDGLVVPFAGLAGGSIGIYQIDVTIPADWATPEALLQCRMEFRGDTERIRIAVDAPATSPKQ